MIYEKVVKTYVSFIASQIGKKALFSVAPEKSNREINCRLYGLVSIIINIS